MKSMVVSSGVVAVMGIVLLTSQGCSKKWFQSSGESESGAVSKGANSKSNFPRISGGGSTGELSGFSQTPSEERLAQAGGANSMSRTPSDLNARRRAGLTKEEKAEEMAALEAGLQDVFFGYDKWTLSDAGIDALNQDAKYLKDHPGSLLKIEGHCDERGSGDYNMVLGDKRAKAARNYLIESGVRPKQVTIVSFGKERPFCFDRDESCYQQNRRGHMLLRTKN